MKSSTKLTNLTGAAAALLLMASQGAWGVVYTGELTWAGGGIHATGPWAQNGTKFSWTVQDTGVDPDNGFAIWQYSYTFTGVDKDISHFIVELSDGSGGTKTFTESDFISPPSGEHEIDTYTETGPGSSNPGIPGPLYGVKFDFGDDETTQTVSFTTLRAPVWGDFYAKDGTDDHGTVDVNAHNLGFELTDPTDPARSGSLDGHILRPDSEGLPPSAVPVPPAVWLFGSALAGLIAISRRDGKAVA